MRGGVDARLHDLVGKLRAIDPLNARVTKLERRLASLEHPTQKPTRRTATRARPTTTRRAGTAAGAPDDVTATTAAGADAPA